MLVVDDSEDQAESMTTLLDFLGYEVRSAHAGTEALATARSFRPDAVLLDIGLPGMDGFEVARRLRREPQLADVVLIAQSGWSDAEDRRRSEDAGIDHYLVKPVDLDELKRLLAAVTPRYR